MFYFIHVTTFAREINVLSAKNLRKPCKKILAESSMYDNIHEPKLLQPITSLYCSCDSGVILPCDALHNTE